MSKPSRILTILKKELIFSLRDPDLILTIFLLPMIIYPLMALGGTIFLGQAMNKVEKTEVRVILPEILQPFSEKLATGTLKLSFAAKPEENLGKLRKGDVDAIVEVASMAADFADPRSAKSLELRIRYDGTRWRSDKASDDIYDALAELRIELREKRLEQQKLNKDFFWPLSVQRKNIAKPEKVGGYMVGNVLPMIVIVFSMLSAFYASIDLTIGEKERGTLETLLLSPISFKEILLGKFLTVVSVILLSVASNLLFLGGTFKFGLYQLGKMVSENLVIETSYSVILLIFVMMIPFAATVAGIMMTISFMGKSMKEAQNYLAPLLSLMILPAVSGAIPGVDLTPLTACIPIVNISLMFKAFLLGEWSINLYLLTISACSVHCLIALTIALRLFRSEDLFDRSASEFVHFFHPVPPNQTSPSARAALMIFGLVVSLAFFIGDSLQNSSSWSLVTGLAMLQLVVILAPPMAYLLFYRFKLVATLDLNFAKLYLRNFFLIPVLSLCVLTWVMQYSLIQNHFFPAPVELNQMFVGFFDVAPLWWVFIVGSLLAGFCEEVLFRGVILKGLQTRLGPVIALIITSCLFGLFHITPYKMISTGLIGLWLGYLYQRTGSLWSSIYGHAFNNAVALTAVYAFFLQGEKEPQVSNTLMLPIPLLVVTALVFFFLLPMLKKAEDI